MCGRYVNVAADTDLLAEFDAEQVVGDPLPPSWNVAPTDPVRVVLERRPKDEPDADAVRQLRTVRWGLVPSWSKDAKGGARMINARIETVTGKPAFTKAAGARRCLVPALGYYEWRRDAASEGGGKTPFFLHGHDGGLLAMAGLYELWRDRSRDDADPQRWLWSCTVITQQATDALGEIHDRNPVVVPRDLQAAWLDCSSGDPATAQALLDRIPQAHLEPYEVGAAVGNVRNNSPELIDPVAGAEPAQLSLDVGAGPDGSA